MKQKRFLRALSVIASLIMFLSVINIPALSVNADGLNGEPWIVAGEDTEYATPNSAAIDDFISNWYKVALGRNPYPSELKQWKKELTGGVTCGARAAYGFIFSAEYQNKKKNNDAFVTDLYKLMLGRKPDAQGKADWVNLLKKGASREQVFAGFANSDEYYTICSKLKITAGYWEANVDPNRLNSVNMFVERLYKVTLGRIGDKDGQVNWVQKLIKGQITGAQCAHDFIFSKEYVKKNLSNSDYVKNLYKALMGREYDQSGLNDWVIKLEKGMSRDEVFAGFVKSPEFEKICKNYGIKKGDYVPTDIGTYDPDKNILVNLKVGDTVKFGKYEQDNNLKNGKEAVKWDVLDVQGNKALLISHDVLDAKAFDESGSHRDNFIQWENCTLRKWLNGQFINDAFDKNEKSKIQTVSLKNYEFDYNYLSDQETYKHKQLKTTKDKVFCLSLDEIKKYYNFEFLSDYNTKLMCKPTKYALNTRKAATWSLTEEEYNSRFKNYKGFKRDMIGVKYGCFWLRDTEGPVDAGYLNYGYEVFGPGIMGDLDVSYEKEGVRPAIYVEFIKTK